MECLEALAENHDLDYGVQDEEGKTALSWACEMGADLAVEVGDFFFFFLLSFFLALLIVGTLV